MLNRYNNTDKPVYIKTWTMPIDQVTNNQVIMLKSKGVLARACLDQEWFTAPNGDRYSYGKGGHAEFETTCEDQEIVLKLMYGDKLILKMQEIVLSGYMQCTLKDLAL